MNWTVNLVMSISRRETSKERSLGQCINNMFTIVVGNGTMNNVMNLIVGVGC